ncbi:hypothetical protein ACHMW5_16870 [Azospirillum melinis]|uniref:hypothetical protein n=1 Tax=Azospirillum melinis TaxID=328839 RepID=UPI003757A353
MAKQSPPIPVEPASTTLWTAQAATAASIAVPPALRISTAVRVAAGWEVAAMPLRPMASDRPGSSKLRMVSVDSPMLAFCGEGPDARASSTVLPIWYTKSHHGEEI